MADITVPVTVTQLTQTTQDDLENNLYSVTFDNFPNIITLPQTTQTTEGDLENNLYPVGWTSFLTITFDPPVVSETTEDGGQLNTFIIRPLGFEPLREYWI
jgi:hypothetical protein